MRNPFRNPFPCTLPNGETIVDERCVCGKLRTEHLAGGGGAFGHGPCSASGCEKFRFAYRVVAGVPELVK